jgi:DNA-binding CsgD family transcriptional regulator
MIPPPHIPALSLATRLTPMEREILSYVGRGYQDHEIAKNTGPKSTSAVRAHIARAKAMLGVSRREVLVLWCVLAGVAAGVSVSAITPQAAASVQVSRPRQPARLASAQRRSRR